MLGGLYNFVRISTQKYLSDCSGIISLINDKFPEPIRNPQYDQQPILMTCSRALVNRPIIRLTYFSVIILNFCVAFLFVYIWLSAARSSYFEQVDFTTFYRAGAMARDGLGKNLYDLAAQSEYQQKILTPGVIQKDVLPFNNPPFTAYPFILLSLLPLTSAFYLWTLLQIGMLFWLLSLLYRLSGSWSPPERWLLISGVLAFTPLLIGFMLGTFSLFLLVCLFQYYFSLKRDREVCSAVWLVLELIKPQLALVPGILLIGARRWKTVSFAAVLGLALVLVSVITFGMQTWFDFVRNINSASVTFNSFAIAPAIEYNLKGFLTLLMGNGRSSSINLISLAALILSFMLTLWIWRGSWQPKNEFFEVKVSLTIMLGLVLSLHLNPYDSLLIVLPAVLFYNYLRERKFAGAALGILLVSCPYIFLLDFFVISGSLGVHIPFIVMVVITGWIGFEFFRERQKGSLANVHGW